MYSWYIWFFFFNKLPGYVQILDWQVLSRLYDLMYNLLWNEYELHLQYISKTVIVWKVDTTFRLINS